MLRSLYLNVIEAILECYGISRFRICIGFPYMPYPYPLQREGEGQAGSGTPFRSPAPALGCYAEVGDLC